MDKRQYDRLRRAWVWAILPLVVYTLAAGFVTWPLARQLDTHAAGAGYGDTYELTRHIWWTREALLDGHNPFDQRLLAYPDGFMSWVHWSHPLQYLPGAVLALAFSPLMATNLMFVISLVLNGVTAYWLGLALNGRRTVAALLGGLVFLAYPAVQGRLSAGHLGIVSLYPVPLFTLFWLRALDGTARWRDVLWGGVWFAVAALMYISQIVFVLLPLVALTGIAALLWGRGRLFRRGVLLREQPWLRAIVMLAWGGLLLVPFYAPLLTAEGRAEVRGVRESGRVDFSSDVLAAVSPSPFGPLADIGLVPGYARDAIGINTIEGTAYVGVIAVMLALLALRERAAWRWALLALGALLLALGPLLKWRGDPVTLRIEDYRTYITLPWALLERLPGLNATRAPGRFNLVTGLALSALVSLGAARLSGWVRRRVLRGAIAVGLAVLILLEYQLFSPFLTDDAAQPGYFDQLARQDDVQAVYNVPAQHNLAAKFALYQQTLHGKAMIGGHALRRSLQDPAILALLDRALLGATDDTAGEDAVLPPVPGDAIPALLRETGADRVILHKRFVTDLPGALARVRGALGEPEFEDAQIAVFPVPEPAAFPGDIPVMAQGRAGWSVPVRLDGGAAAFMGDQAAWHVYAPGPFYGELTIPLQGYARSRKIAVRLDGDLLAGIWAEPDVKAVRVPLWVESGFHTLHFEALEDCTPYPFSVTCLGGGDCRSVEPPPCISAAFGAPAWEAAEPAVKVRDVALDHGMRLRGYDVAVIGEPRAVRVRLFWDAPGALPESYALFVHLTQPDDPAPLAQYADYPAITTDAWDGGAVWVSDVVIELGDDIPPGQYALNAGWFVPQTGERLAVRGDGPLAGAGIVQLGSVTLE